MAFNALSDIENYSFFVYIAGMSVSKYLIKVVGIFVNWIQN